MEKCPAFLKMRLASKCCLCLRKIVRDALDRGVRGGLQYVSRLASMLRNSIDVCPFLAGAAPREITAGASHRAYRAASV